MNAAMLAALEAQGVCSESAAMNCVQSKETGAHLDWVPTWVKQLKAPAQENDYIY